VCYTYKIPLLETIAFQVSFHLGLADKITPRWLLELLGTGFLAAVFLATLWITDGADRAIFLTLWVWFTHWLWQKGVLYVRRKRAAHYLASLPASEDWISEITDGYLVTENRGTRISLPLSGLTRVFEEKGFVYLDFEDRGRARIPFTAFPSVQDRDSFVATLSAQERPRA
jgi:hypothetical protein